MITFDILIILAIKILYFSDYEAHLYAFIFAKNHIVAPYNLMRLMYKFWLCLLNSNQFYGVGSAQKSVKMFFFSTLVRYEATPLDGLSEHCGYCRQEPRGVIRIMLQHNVNTRSPKCHLLRDIITNRISNSRLRWE